MNRRNINQLLAASLILILCAAVTVSAESYQGQTRQGTTNQQMRMQGQSQQRMAQQQTRVQGQIQSLQTRSINNQPMVVARVQTQDDRTTTVLLGSRQALRNVDLQRGDQVTITGQRVRLNQQPALKAQQLRTNGQTFRLSQRGRQQGQFQQQQQQQFRQQQMGQRQQMGGRQQQQQQRQMQLSGTIEDLKQVKLYGQQQPHLVAAVSTQRGQTRVVDLGPANQVRNLNLQTGDRLQVRGSRGSINNNPVFIARQVQAGGQSTQVRRTWNRNDFRLSGRIVNTTTTTLPGDNQQHVIALVETEQGNRYPVDLGPRQRLSQQNMSVSQGQNITLIVQPTQAGNQRILEAKKISTGNRVLQRNI